MATKELIRLMERFLVTRGHANYVQVCEKENENENESLWVMLRELTLWLDAGSRGEYRH